MFKKFKDKLAEEVKSSPQRIQQFAQAAQAAVTSASSSISDITNNDLFSIGDNDNNRNPTSSNSQPTTYQEISLAKQNQQVASDLQDTMLQTDETPRQRRLSNSSFSSDISFRLPTYESPSMYHVQSDMDVSASEAEERFSGGVVNLDRVSKEELYFAYRRTRERCTKYKTQYADLARHYKLLERENSKARNVLVETQDKALRRISELKEQCTLEQSAKAHLERALRVEIEEKNIKIDTFITKVKLLQENKENDNFAIEAATDRNENDNTQLIDLKTEETTENTKQDSSLSEITALNSKITKMEQLINKYKESLKVSKEKNAQISSELQMLTTELENKVKENETLKVNNENLISTEKKVEELNDVIEKLQNSQSVLEFTKNKEVSVLKLDLEQAQEEISQLNTKILGLKKREEEYAISLAENKLSIHKELESKEAEINSLKDSLSTSQNEVQSLKIVITDYKKKLSSLEEEQAKLKENLKELSMARSKLIDQNNLVEELNKKIQLIEHSKGKIDEEFKCLELQLRQETAEKLAMQDRNLYLENRNTQLSEDNQKKISQINSLESELKSYTKGKDETEDSGKQKLETEVQLWKYKYNSLESEIQEERDELVKLHSEIEKLLCNHESVQNQNIQLLTKISELETRTTMLQEQNENIKSNCLTYLQMVKTVQQNIYNTKQEILLLLKSVNNDIKNNVETNIYKMASMITGEKNNDLHLIIDSLQQDVRKIKTAYENTKIELQLQKEKNELLQNKFQEEKARLEEASQVLNANSAEHNLLIQNFNTLKKEKQDLYESSKCMEEDNKKFKESIQKYEKNCKKLEKDYAEMVQGHEQYETKIEENNNLTRKNEELQNEINKLNLEIQSLVNKLSDSQEHMIQIKSENEKLITDIKHIEACNFEMKNKHHNLSEKIKETETKHNKTESEQNNLRERIEEIQNAHFATEIENKTLQDNMNVIESNHSKLETDNNELNCKLKETLEYNSALCLEKEKISIYYNNIISDNVNLKDEVETLKTQLENNRMLIESIKTENNVLQKTIQNYDQNIKYTQELEETLKHLRTENLDLKRQTEEISNSIKQSELEMLQVRKSHIVIEEEKDRLNAIIRDLEKKEDNFKDSIINNHANTQTTDDVSEVMSVNPPDNGNTDISESQFSALKEENKRLHSDIEGLQNYLAKVSKENSDLNEKLREVISCNEFTEQSELSLDDIEALRNEIQSGKDRINNLTRENMLLVEENLELKDQIHVQCNDDDKENDFNKKYNSLLEIKNNLEKRVNDLESSNWSINSNMQEMQGNNEKLRLSNDKLGRRLDEALVSLRHLHSLQENTELEYLRNILYEYLTGSGTHSLTLAKVLSAVVKFNDAQTELVLQKEKERQSLLRQLGIIL